MIDPLDELIVKEPENPNKILADCIKDFVKMTPEGNLIFEPDFYNQPEWKRVLLTTLGRKAAYTKKLCESESISLKELSKLSSVPTTSVTRTTGRELKNIVKTISKGNYHIPDYNLVRSKKLLENEVKKK